MSAGVVLAPGAGRLGLRELLSTGSEPELVEGSRACTRMGEISGHYAHPA